MCSHRYYKDIDRSFVPGWCLVGLVALTGTSSQFLYIARTVEVSIMKRCLRVRFCWDSCSYPHMGAPLESFTSQDFLVADKGMLQSLVFAGVPSWPSHGSLLLSPYIAEFVEESLMKAHSVQQPLLQLGLWLLQLKLSFNSCKLQDLLSSLCRRVRQGLAVTRELPLEPNTLQDMPICPWWSSGWALVPHWWSSLDRHIWASFLFCFSQDVWDPTICLRTHCNFVFENGMEESAAFAGDWAFDTRGIVNFYTSHWRMV